MVVTVQFDRKGQINHAYQHEGSALTPGGGYMSPEVIPLEIKMAAWDTQKRVE